jgi:polyphosphate kinase
VTEFIEAAANDPDVLAIKMTLYRTSAESPIIRSLIKAASNGKQVVALVELKARFDEANNIQWARQLERGGCHVVYGIVGLKTHCKAVLVVRREGKQLRRYCHLGTGNYNPSTATLYTDVSLLTASEAIGEDIGDLFNMLTGYAEPGQFRSIVISPDGIHRRLLELIAAEAEIARKGRPASITCKMNNLVDPQMIRALYRASQAGVRIHLVVRGICCLRPQVPGFSENIQVRSIVGRFLEHSRVFQFGNGGQPLVYISSGDWMQRNFFSRVEIMTPVEESTAQGRLIEEILDLSWSDEANSWELRADGTWQHRIPATPGQLLDSHSVLIQREQAVVHPSLVTEVPARRQKDRGRQAKKRS